MSQTFWVWMGFVLASLPVVAFLLIVTRQNRLQPGTTSVRLCSFCSLPAGTTGFRCSYCGHTRVESASRRVVLFVSSVSLIASIGFLGGVCVPRALRDVPHSLSLAPVGWAQAMQQLLLPVDQAKTVLASLPIQPFWEKPFETLQHEDEPRALLMSAQPDEEQPPTPTDERSKAMATKSSSPVDPESQSEAESLVLNPFVSRSASDVMQARQTSAPEMDSTPAQAASVMTCGGLVPADRPEPDFDPYMKAMQARIRQYWVPPNADRNKRVVVAYRIACNGGLLQARILESSGIAVADQAALRAIRKAAPFAALPSDYRAQAVEVQFAFDYDILTRTSNQAKK